jgi:hypothetical protein
MPTGDYLSVLSHGLIVSSSEGFPTPTGDLASRVLTAFRNIVAAVNFAQTPSIPTAKTYRRSVLDLSGPRDGPLSVSPISVVAPTPGGTVGKRKLLQWRETTYQVSALVMDAQGGSVAVGDEWRLTWVDRIWEALDEADWDGAGVPEFQDVNPDRLVQLDPAAFTDAGSWSALVSAVIICREYFNA